MAPVVSRNENEGASLYQSPQKFSGPGKRAARVRAGGAVWEGRGGAATRASPHRRSGVPFRNELRGYREQVGQHSARVHEQFLSLRNDRRRLRVGATGRGFSGCARPSSPPGGPRGRGRASASRPFRPRRDHVDLAARRCPCPCPAPPCSRTAPLRACPLTTTPRRRRMTRNLKAISAPARLPVSEGATPIPQGPAPSLSGGGRPSARRRLALTRYGPSRCLTRTSGLFCVRAFGPPSGSNECRVPAPRGPRGLLFQPLPRWHRPCPQRIRNGRLDPG